MNWSRLKSDASLVAVLSATPFVTIGEEEKPCPPSVLYDPDVPLWAAAFGDAKVFPSGQFAFPSWLKVRNAQRLI